MKTKKYLKQQLKKLTDFVINHEDLDLVWKLERLIINKYGDIYIFEVNGNGKKTN